LSVSFLLFPVVNSTVRKYYVSMIWVDISYWRSDYSSPIVSYRKSGGDCPSVKCAFSLAISFVGNCDSHIVRRDTEPIDRNV